MRSHDCNESLAAIPRRAQRSTLLAWQTGWVLYRTIDAAFWTDRKVSALEPHARLLFLYLITNPHTHVSGIYYLDLDYAAADVSIKKNTLSALLDTLCKAGFCAYDQAKGIVWVRNMFAYQGSGDKNARSAAYHIANDLHGSYLCGEFLSRYPQVAKYYNEGIRRRKREPIPNHLRFKILTRDGNRCKSCGKGPDQASLEVDYILAVADGGSNDEDNLQILCQPCNLGKLANRPIGYPAKDGGATPDSRSLIPDSRLLNPEPPIVPPEGDFDKFWEIYPRKEAKQRAYKAWLRIRPQNGTCEQILNAIQAQKLSDQWRRGIIPHPATWLNDQRWLDENMVDDRKEKVLEAIRELNEN